MPQLVECMQSNRKDNLDVFVGANRNGMTRSLLKCAHKSSKRIKRGPTSNAIFPKSDRPLRKRQNVLIAHFVSISFESEIYVLVLVFVIVLVKKRAIGPMSMRVPT